MSTRTPCVALSIALVLVALFATPSFAAASRDRDEKPAITLGEGISMASLVVRMTLQELTYLGIVTLTVATPWGPAVTALSYAT